MNNTGLRPDWISINSLIKTCIRKLRHSTIFHFSWSAKQDGKKNGKKLTDIVRCSENLLHFDSVLDYPGDAKVAELDVRVWFLR